MPRPTTLEEWGKTFCGSMFSKLLAAGWSEAEAAEAAKATWKNMDPPGSLNELGDPDQAAADEVGLMQDDE